MTQVRRMEPMPRVASWASRLSKGSTVVAPSGRLLILIFHRVLHERDPMFPDEPDATDFAARADLLAQHFNVLPLLEAAERLRSGSLPPRPLCITFDDGYRDNLQVAAPILSARRLSATVFVAPGFSAGGAMFNDVVIEALRVAPDPLDLDGIGLGTYALPDTPARIRAAGVIIGKLKYLDPGTRWEKSMRVAEAAHLAELPRRMMTVPELRKLKDHGVDIGAHTVQHPILRSVDEVEARREIYESREMLESWLGSSVRAFAYPNGKPGDDYGPEHVRIVAEAGFDIALSTAWGSACDRTDRLQLPRVAPWDSSAMRYVARLLWAYRQIQPVAQA